MQQNCSLMLYVSITLWITFETCVLLLKGDVYDQKYKCAKGMQFLRGPHVIKCAELLPFSEAASQGAHSLKNSSFQRWWLFVRFQFLASQSRTQLFLVCNLAFLYTLIELIDPCGETLSVYSGGKSYNIKVCSGHFGHCCHKSMAHGTMCSQGSEVQVTQCLRVYVCLYVCCVHFMFSVRKHNQYCILRHAEKQHVVAQTITCSWLSGLNKNIYKGEACSHIVLNHVLPLGVG